MPKPIVAITHTPDRVGEHYPAADLDRLRAVADIRIVGDGKDRAALLAQLGDVDIITGSWGMPKLSSDLLEAAPRLRAVCYAAGTVKGFVTPESYARGVIITTAMHANAVPVAETTVALITLINKNWFVCLDRIRAGGLKDWWNKEPWFPGNFGATVGLVGLGAIGRIVAERLRTYDVQVLAYDPYAKPEVFASLGAIRVDSLVELARRSWILSVHAPNIPACEGMINAEVLAAMPDGATLINTARGKLVDEPALVAELSKGRIKAHLDVTWPEPPAADSPLLRLPNVWLTPHLAGSHSREIQRMGRLAVDECVRILAGQAPTYGVEESMLHTMA